MGRSRENTMNRLLQAASETIIFQGVSRIGILATSNRAGVDSALVYRYFGGWTGLIEALFRQMISKIDASRALTTELADERVNTVERRAEYVLLFYKELQTDPAFGVLLRWQINNPETELGRCLDRLVDESIQEVVRGDSIETGMFRLLLTGITYTTYTNSQNQTSREELTEQIIHRMFSQREPNTLSELVQDYIECTSETALLITVPEK